MRWFMRLIRRERLERELEAEMQHHVSEHARRLHSEGVAPAEARRRALATFGGLEPIREQTRDARGTRWVEDLGRDVRYACRMMRRSPVFSVAAVLSVAVGIGANGAIFSVADSLLMRPLDVTKPEQLYFLNRAGYDQPYYRFSVPAVQRLAADVPGVQFAAGHATTRVQLDRKGGSEFAIGQLVTGNWFSVLGVRAALGRVLEPADAEAPGSRPVVVLSHDAWVANFGADSQVVGTTLSVNGTPTTIVGVAAEGFVGLDVASRVALWAPVTMQHELRVYGNASIDDGDMRKPWFTQEGISWLTVVARVPASMSSDAAASRIRTWGRRETEQAAAGNKDLNAEQREYRLREHIEMEPGARGMSYLRDSFSQPLRVLMVTVAAVLLIACANLASLLLARSSARSREFALRLSLGAGRGRVMRQLLTETLALSAIGGVVGLGVAHLGGRALLSMASSGTQPIPLDLPVDWQLIGFIVVATLVTGVLFGLGPALRASRPGLGDPLKAGGRVTGAEGRTGTFGFGKVLIAVQVGLSLTLLAGALLFLQTFQNLLTADTGFDRVNVLSARIDPILSGITEAQLPDVYARLVERTKAIPGATHAALALSGPLSGSARTSSIAVDNEPVRVGNESSVRVECVSAEYFQTIGLPLVKGRLLTDQDGPGRPKVAVVNEQMARHFFGDRDPIGHRFGFDDPDVEIVGIVRDSRIDGPRVDVPAMVYLPLPQRMEYVRNMYLRMTGPIEQARAAFRNAITAVHPRLAVREVASLDELAARLVTTDRLVARLTGIFSALAVAVACLGLYGSIAFSVVRRTNEIGVRIALGATPGSVRWLILRETLVVVGFGCALGLAALWPLLAYLRSLLFGLEPHDPATLISAVASLLVVGMIAGAIPAWRASRVDPLRALRAE